ncbi:conserved hypothetical protein [Parvibaculum lavamentivorans DS-1]|uniref:Alginate export domain-containing protein n=1 Tax=Parvibaculum lavamentivorans (strain DS-1 / DSM 13023 / NCIMB 13966) TaxID=402881 RepID=A7HVR3_PARL1|nr:alginate export family protein [Parvibaculum lavamentivorans]ABS63996.1 conserved hypothetical protein [Parvibaculum lavamentivorans DS-1]
MRAVAFALLLVAFPDAVKAACGTGFMKLRFDEDPSCFRTEAPGDALDRLKFMPLDRDGDVWLGMGGEIRQRYEYTNNPAFGAARQDKAGVWLQRYVLHGDLHLGSRLRLFGQLSSALESGRAGGGSPVDENRLEIQNAFADVTPFQVPLTLRAGRQELQFGSGRLVDVREGPNVRRSFDGIRAFVAAGGWRVDALAVRPRLSRPGAFDDKTNHGQSLWGLYAAGPGLDLYYLGFQSDASVFVQGTAKEHRHSIGARLWGARDGWDWNLESLYQFGSFGAGDISAWTVASETGYRWETAAWQPRVALSANIASGDDDPADGDLGTFSPLFPRGNYFSEAAVLGPRNFYNLHAFLTVEPAQDWTLTTDVNFFWRLETEDGVYTPGGSLLRGPGGSDERFVGSAFSLSSSHTLSQRIDATAIYTHFSAGDFLESTGSSADIDFLELTLRFRF